MERRFIPNPKQGDHQILRVCDKTTGAIAWLYCSKKQQICAVGYAARARKPGFHHIYSTEQKRAAAVERYFGNLRAHKEQVEKRRKEQHQPHRLELGHVLHTNWGYDQTNVEFFEITKLIGKTMVELRELGQISQDTEWAQGRSVPKLGDYIGDPIRRRVNMASSRPSVRIDDVRTAWVWSGRAVSWSSYA